MADNLTRAQRSYTMSRIRSQDTLPELAIRRLAHARGLRFRTHCKSLPGCPDLVFATARVAVFIDGDFWHGWRFPRWCHKLSPYWKAKLERNRRRDQINFRRLRYHGWFVIRIWEHRVWADPARCVDKIVQAVRSRSQVGSR